MRQMKLVDAEYTGKRKQTRKELFLIKMDRGVLWEWLSIFIESQYPKGDPLIAMLRVQLMQDWFGCSKPAIHDAVWSFKPVASAPTFNDESRSCEAIVLEVVAMRCSRELNISKRASSLIIFSLFKFTMDKIIHKYKSILDCLRISHAAA